MNRTVYGLSAALVALSMIGAARADEPGPDVIGAAEDECFDKGAGVFDPCDPEPEELQVLEEPQVVFDVAPRWSGFYAGVQGGFFTGDIESSSLTGGFPEFDVNGGTIGAQFGYLTTLENNVVLGFEVDASAVLGADESFTGAGGTLESDVNFFATARGRLGYDYGRYLPYVTAGIGFNTTETDFASVGGAFVEDTDLQVGGVFGAGLEYAITDQLSLRGEALYFLPAGDGALLTAPGDTVESGLDDAIVGRIGLNFRF